MLLARVDFEVVQFFLSTDLEFSLGQAGVAPIAPSPTNPSFGSATVHVLPPHVGPCPEDYGDLDYNGVVDFRDIPRFIDVLRNGYNEILADMNFDGVVNFSDIPPFIQRLSQ